MSYDLTGGALTWAEFHSKYGELTCTWQDLDGMRRGPLPATRPPTSIVHGWSADGTTLLRARLDGDRVWHAVVTCTPQSALSVSVQTPFAWGSSGRTAQFRGDGTQTEALAQVVVDDAGEGSLVFLIDPPLVSVWN